MVAADLVKHFEDRVAALDGKAMIVCMSRRICVALYDADRDAAARNGTATTTQAGAIKVVMTGSAADPPALAAAYRQPRRGAICSPSAPRTRRIRSSS